MQLTAYAITCTLDAPFDQTVRRVTDALSTEGFGVLTTIDVQATMKQKLDLDVPAYVILGACNPSLASAGLAAELDLGVLLPCNVVVRTDGDRTVVAAMEPLVAMRLAGNPVLELIAVEARERIERVIASL